MKAEVVRALKLPVLINLAENIATLGWFSIFLGLTKKVGLSALIISIRPGHSIISRTGPTERALAQQRDTRQNNTNSFPIRAFYELLNWTKKKNVVKTEGQTTSRAIIFPRVQKVMNKN